MNQHSYIKGVNEYDLICVGSDSQAPGEKQLHIFKLLPLREEKHRL